MGHLAPLRYSRVQHGPHRAQGHATGGRVHVLAVPMDPRIPKIRVATRQAEALQGTRFLGVHCLALPGLALGCLPATTHTLAMRSGLVLTE
jgi:hypothetical protein